MNLTPCFLVPALTACYSGLLVSTYAANLLPQARCVAQAIITLCMLSLGLYLVALL